MYDVNRPDTIKAVQDVLNLITTKEHNLIRGKVGDEAKNSVPVKYILGNKIDLMYQQKVDEKWLQDLAEK